MSKFKVGDKVICIEGTAHNDHTYKYGAGWKKGFQFTITQISNNFDGIAWGGYHSHGVYLDCIQLVSEYKPTQPKQFGVAIFCKGLNK